MALETSKRQQCQPFKSSAIHSTRLQYKPFSSLSSLPQPLTPKIPGISFKGKWCSSLPICSLSQMLIMPVWSVTKNEFQASETTLKVTGLQPLSTIIAGSTNTLSTVLTDIPDPTVCNYLFCSIETTTSFSTSTYLLCFSRQITSYTTNHIKFIFPVLFHLYPTLQITDVWENPRNHPTKETIAELLAHSKLHL